MSFAKIEVAVKHHPELTTFSDFCEFVGIDVLTSHRKAEAAKVFWLNYGRVISGEWSYSGLKKFAKEYAYGWPKKNFQKYHPELFKR